MTGASIENESLLEQECPTIDAMANRAGRPSLPKEQADRVLAELRALIAQVGTQRDVAKLLRVSETTISNWKQGQSPTYEHAVAIAAARKIPIWSLMGTTEPLTSPLRSNVHGQGAEGAAESMAVMLRMQRERFPRLEALAVADEGRRVRRWNDAVIGAARSGFFGDEDHDTDEWEEMLDELQSLWTKRHPPDSRRGDSNRFLPPARRV